MSLEKILQSQGIASRKECRRIIQSGAVSSDGVVLQNPDEVFSFEGFGFNLAGETFVCREHVYLALNKPVGYECSHSPTHHKSVYELLPEHFTRRGLESAGRLDQDTTGLLIMSDDGAFLHSLASPKKHVPKTYIACTAHDPTDEFLSLLSGGVMLNDEKKELSPLSCEIVGEKCIKITIDQGKYHQVKRMIAAAGNRCVSLQRVSVGLLNLDALKISSGEWKYLEKDEIALLRG